MRRNLRKLLTELALCWIHEGRHSPFGAGRTLVNQGVQASFWDFYGDLLKFQNPSPEMAAKLSTEFDELFSTKTIYGAHDRIEKTKDKKDELKHPCLDSELGAIRPCRYPRQEQQQKILFSPLSNRQKIGGRLSLVSKISVYLSYSLI